MNTLTLDKALELYEVLGKHLPPEPDDDALEFIGKIINSIKNSGQHKDYTDAVMLMSEKSWEEIKELESKEVLELFTEGLIINRIVKLQSFCITMGLSHA